ncbi:cyanocobalamin reductase / alkylcobalamin dealkylase [Callorhinchus milii]|uniref:Cyanocobalamin reductase / alkylcobalamin dealkylase n=1 Tax=Callorhinchus milii TaxID=7868 RepID=V9L2Z1_CALMI|nr:cyanocobalamin reductase / alkylcobalamin dealkylase [Callorhinchus milii]|eukprot:gi/632963810/ref/XP_007898091.1/ PREDICTED: methylmalonic aciduria and homocystinuria type C protein [Callorhinchus milii]
MAVADAVAQRLRELLTPGGFECHPFKIGWYNAILQPTFHLKYPDDTLAFVVLSTPQMYEKSFKPFIISKQFAGVRDPIDECVAQYFFLVKENLSEQRIEAIHDFEILPNRRPKVLVQTAAHVAGAAYYYQKNNVKKNPWGEKKIYGVCIHPRYGGWFAIRGVLIFQDLQIPSLEQRPPVDCVSTKEKIIELLERFNFHWRDWTYRDIIEVEERYSEDQKQYFATPPSKRLELLGLKNNCLSY